ncbi:AAA family ATPase [Solidesulfovibrio magneticus]|uniref:Rad50/SbcC-type AAA domain-containing protein n=1 Tax=Solidesulfovibrio magneticus (strain ATCC 700980 / DSM 13731 / RS-1) TaxID=573370 RepID=C4XLE6_SOLM1|nr:ATP-binding protein [Solidesulfovibrio magneticus]BAH77085.1 hypothetical protein DMR_35940 [Solidesulfovibrio magneticus RS-1]
MIRRLTLVDFMAHGRTVIDLPPGLTALTGPNNSGKSAVVEALRCLTENPPPRHCIRHGAAEARVEAELADGTVIAWVRRPKYALYEVRRPGAEEPETYAKMGRGVVPEDVRKLLRLGPVAVDGGETVDVHLGNQREPVFLLSDKSGPKLAAFFAAASEAAHLIAMQAALSKRTTQKKAEKKRLDKALGGHTQALDKLSPLPAIELALDRAAELEAALAQGQAEADRLAGLLAERKRLAGRAAVLGQRARRLSRLSPPPALAATIPLAETVARQQTLGRAVARFAARVAALSPLGAPLPLAPTAELAGLARAVAEGRLALGRQTRRAAALAGLAAPPQTADTAALAELAGSLADSLPALARLISRRRALSALAEPPSPAATDELARLAAAVAALRGRAAALARRGETLARVLPPPETADAAALSGLGRTADSLLAARQTLAAKQAELADRQRMLDTFSARAADRLAALGACPLCGASLTAEAFFAGGHVHDAAGDDGGAS